MNPIIKDLGKVIPTAEEVYDSTKEYDTLSLVSNASKTKLYLSKQVVPAGTPLEDNKYWGCLVDFDGQIIEYKELLDEFKELIDNFEDVIDDIYARCYTFIDSEDRNMNNLLNPGIYKYCTLGRPPLAVDKEFYTLETLDGGIIKENDEASLYYLQELYHSWAFMQNSPVSWEEPDTAPRGIITPTIYDKPYLEINNCFAYIEDRDWDDQGPAQRLEDNWCYLSGNYARQHYSTVTDAQQLTRFKRELPIGEYNVYMTIYPSATGVRDRLAIPTQLPTIVAQCVGGGGGTFNPSGSYTVNDLIRTEVESTSPKYVVSFRVVHSGGDLTILIENETPGYNWFVFTARISPVDYTFTNVYSIIPQKCISHKTGVIHSRTLYSADKSKPFAPFTFYPKYDSFDKDLNKVESYWNLVVPGELLLSILGIGEESQGVIDKFNEVKEFLKNISADTKLIDLLHDVTPIKYIGNVAKQNAVHETANNTNTMSPYAQNSLIFGTENQITVNNPDTTTYYPTNIVVEGNDNVSDAKNSHVEGRTNSAVWDVNGAMRRAGYSEELIQKYNLTDDASYGADCAHAEGYRNVASGWISHAEGNKNVAAGRNAHAEGHETLAAGSSAHSEGRSTIARGSYSHAQGNSTEANGASSFTAGKNTVANNEAETALGKYNVSSADTLFSIGFGTADNNRKNAFEVKNNGGLYISDTSVTELIELLKYTITGKFLEFYATNDVILKGTQYNTIRLVAKYPTEFTTISIRDSNAKALSKISSSYVDGKYTVTYGLTNDSTTVSDNLNFQLNVRLVTGVEITISSSIKAVDRIYYGFSSSPTTLSSYASARESYAGEYTATSSTNNLGFYIAIPQSMMTIAPTNGQSLDAYMNGVPVSLVYTGVRGGSGPYYNAYIFGIGTIENNSFVAQAYPSGTTLNITIK